MPKPVNTFENKIYISASGALYVDTTLLTRSSEQREEYGIFTELPKETVPGLPEQITNYSESKTEEELFSELQEAYAALDRQGEQGGESKCSAESIQITSEIETVDDFRTVLISRLKRIDECASGLSGRFPRSKINRYVLAATRYVRLALKNALKRTPRLERSRSAPG